MKPQNEIPWPLIEDGQVWQMNETTCRIGQLIGQEAGPLHPVQRPANAQRPDCDEQGSADEVFAGDEGGLGAGIEIGRTSTRRWQHFRAGSFEFYLRMVWASPALPRSLPALPLTKITSKMLRQPTPRRWGWGIPLKKRKAA